MKKLITYSLCIVFVFTSLSFYAQNEPIKGYRIDGDDIVFTFNKKDYDKVSHDNHGEHLDFDDLDIKNVVVSGEFNNWSRDQWEMEKINEDYYELRKKISDFNDAFSWEFKFIVNNEYWAEPSKNDLNITPAKSHEGKNYYTFNLRAYTGAYPDAEGNVRFRLKGFDNASKVILSGTFNRWNTNAFKMYRIDNGWEIILQLRPDDYEYRFIVDGQWMEDPTNLDKVENEYGEFNSRVSVKKRINFTLRGYSDARNVFVIGSFNDWNEDQYAMKKDVAGNWICSVVLAGGKHHYKYKVDGKWMLDPLNSVQEYDGKGNINSVLMIK